MQIRNGQVAVVTGAASGIGLALALEFGHRGVGVVLADVESELLTAATNEVAALGVPAVGIHTDVRHQDEVDTLAERSLATFGEVHIVCNNAGVMLPFAPMWEISHRAWDWIVDVNLWGVIHGIRSFVPHLAERGIGHVINTASMAGLTTIPFNGPYNATKHAVVSLSETLRAELATVAPGVGVTVVCPAVVNTNIRAAARNRPADVELPSERRAEARGTPSEPMEARQVAIATLAAIETDQLYLAVGSGTGDRARARIESVLADLDN